MAIRELASFSLGAIRVQYHIDDESKQVALSLLPAALADRVAEHRDVLEDGPEYRGVQSVKWVFHGAGLDPLVHYKILGKPYAPGFAQGRTLHGVFNSHRLSFAGQDVIEAGGVTRIVTRLDSPEGYRCRHELTWHVGEDAVEVSTVFENGAADPVTLELLSSFAIGRISPFAADDAPGRLHLHRARSLWSSEGRFESAPFEDLHLERSWAGISAAVERFGQVGSMPVRGFFPFAAIEDRQAGVFWGAQLATPGSWQMEVHHFDDFANLSGGLADREFGHWMKTLAPGQSLTTPRAILSTVAGTLDDLCHALTGVQERSASAAPAAERDMPVVCNEWCTSWGHPEQEYLARLARRLKGHGLRYLVIDAGWYVSDKQGAHWGNSHGDWRANPALFPRGLKAAADAIRAEGLIPGLWFELETLGPMSDAAAESKHQLRRDGLTLITGERRFWDFRDPWVADYLAGRVIGLLRDCGFGYIKVDYNETIGMGADGSDSQGESLRQHLEGVQAFFRQLRAELPDLVIENCSSGGHRLEPSMMALADMGSFSDAHEAREIPIIAANLHRLILPRQSQIWAVLRRYDDQHRMAYSLAAGFLGRLCLSGDLLDLSDAQWRQVDDAVALYRHAAAVIRNGKSRRIGPPVSSYRHPTGWQGVWRQTHDADTALVVLHAFAQPRPDAVRLDLPGTGWTISGQFGSGSAAARLSGDHLLWPIESDYRGAVVLLRRGRKGISDGQ